MNFQSIKPAIVAVPLFSLAMAGCLKDNDFDNHKIQSFSGSQTKVISLGINVRSVQNFSTLAYNNSTKDTTVDLVPVELGGPDAASEDIHVTLVKVDSLVDNLNNDNAASGIGATDYAVPTAVTLVNPVVTIKKGSRTGFLQVKFKPSDLIGADWALGLGVKSVAEPGYTISGNVGTGIVGILTKNGYDGIYDAKGYFIHPTIQTRVGPFTQPGILLATSGATSIDMAGVPFNGGLLGVFPRLTVDPATNLVTVTSADATVITGATGGYINRYDPATRTFYINYTYSGNRISTDTLVFVKPR